MALHADLMVNGQRIGYLYARRLSPDGRPQPDDVCLYEWKVGTDRMSVASPEPVEHRYGDGAWALVARIVEASGSPTRTAHKLGQPGRDPGSVIFP